MLPILLGIVASTLGEVITAINKKLNGTVLQGTGAFLIVFAISGVAAFGKQVLAPGFEWSQFTDWATISATFGQVFTVSQVYFMLVVKKLGLDVKPLPGPVSEKMKLNI